MAILKTNAETLKERTDRAFDTISSIFDDHQEMFIRRQFDSATFDETALACIRLAKEKGFDRLAEEMEDDLKSEMRDV